MTEQGNKQERQNIDKQLWAYVSSLLDNDPDLETFPPERIVVLSNLKSRVERGE